MKHLFTLLYLAATCSAWAQAPADSIKPGPWKWATRAGLNFNQASFSDNWVGGGVSSVGLGSVFNGKAEYDNASFNFATEALLEYGLQKNRDQSLRKTADRIFYDAKLGYKLSKAWQVYASANFQSQFDVGFLFGEDTAGRETRTAISRFMAPAFVTYSSGLEYKPVDYFWARLGVGTFRQTFVLDESLYEAGGVPVADEVFGVRRRRGVRNEVAFQLTSSFDRAIATNLNLKALLQVFANYETLDAPDTRLDVTLSAKVNNWLSVTLGAVALQDKDQAQAFQFSQTLLLSVLLQRAKGYEKPF